LVGPDPQPPEPLRRRTGLAVALELLSSDEPTPVRTLARAAGVSVAAAHATLGELARSGLVTDGRARHPDLFWAVADHWRLRWFPLVSEPTAQIPSTTHALLRMRLDEPGLEGWAEPTDRSGERTPMSGRTPGGSATCRTGSAAATTLLAMPSTSPTAGHRRGPDVGPHRVREPRDLATLAQVAISHAQFESIHPFTDGNGRIGRAVLNAVLRRRGITQRVIVPIASALVAHRDRYFDLLDDYRTGQIAPLVTVFSSATRIAAIEARVTADSIHGLRAEWRDALGRIRRGSATERLLERLADLAAFTVEEAIDEVRGSSSSTCDAVDRLAEAGILRPLTDRKRSQVWGVVSLLDELEDLSARIARRARSERALGS
jgi:hypothetical protein